MKIFDSAQVKEWDAITIREQQISSAELMERAAHECYEWFIKNEFSKKYFRIFCGKGNNGGDGLALARILIENNINVSVYILESGKEGTNDFQENLRRLHLVTKEIYFIQSELFFPQLNKDDVIIDALFGTGLNKPLEGITERLVEFLNSAGLIIVSIDMPVGLFTGKSTKGYTSISATHTLSFQNYKPAFLFAENENAIGLLHLLDINLSHKYESSEETQYELLELSIIKNIIRPRNQFSHKGNFGHAALLAGSYGMMGAAVLAARACCYSGVGKVTVHIPACGYDIMQSCIPEAMCRISGEKYLTSFENNDTYKAIGIGPGTGLHKELPVLLTDIFTKTSTTLLLDADALNCMAADKKLLSLIPHGTLLTPHPKEFDKLFGVASNDFERLELAIKNAADLQIYIVLKGHHTAIITPRGKVYFNNTGNPGMAKAGMGDVLTGIITGLIAQHYPLPEAAILGVYLHGLAGDIAADKFSQQAMQATDLINSLADAWKLLYS